MNIRTKTPIRLTNVPVLEAIFELRFEPREFSAHELLPGLMFPKLKAYVAHLESLGPSHLPQELLQRDPALRYQLTRRLSGKQFTVGFGPRIIHLAALRPYPGWSEFREAINKTLASLRDSEQVKSIERFSIKYRNCIATENSGDQLNALNVNLRVGELDITKKSTRIAVESEAGDFQNLISILTRTLVDVNATSERLFGVLIDVDTVYSGRLDNFWAEIDGLLESAHRTEKTAFFSLLTDETLETLGPVWE